MFEFSGRKTYLLLRVGPVHKHHPRARGESQMRMTASEQIIPGFLRVVSKSEVRLYGRLQHFLIAKYKTETNS